MPAKKGAKAMKSGKTTSEGQQQAEYLWDLDYWLSEEDESFDKSSDDTLSREEDELDTDLSDWEESASADKRLPQTTKKDEEERAKSLMYINSHYFNDAGDIFKSIGMYKKAALAYKQGKNFTECGIMFKKAGMFLESIEAFAGEDGLFKLCRWDPHVRIVLNVALEQLIDREKQKTRSKKVGMDKPGQNATSAVKKGLKAMKSVKATSGDSGQAKVAEMKGVETTSKPKKAENQPHRSGLLPGAQKTRDQIMQNEKIFVRFLNGDEACSFDRGVTPTEIRVAIANKLNTFAPRVKIYDAIFDIQLELIYGFPAGEDLISCDADPEVISSIVIAIVDPNFVFSNKTWEEAMKLHGDAGDVAGVRRVVGAVLDAGIDRSISGKRLLTNVFDGEIGPEMTPCLETLLEVGIDVHQHMGREIENGTVLFTAVRHGNLELVNRLLQAGANVHDRDGFGRTSLILACEMENLEIVKRLMEEGSTVESDGVLRGLFFCPGLAAVGSGKLNDECPNYVNSLVLRKLGK